MVKWNITHGPPTDPNPWLIMKGTSGANCKRSQMSDGIALFFGSTFQYKESEGTIREDIEETRRFLLRDETQSESAIDHRISVGARCKVQRTIADRMISRCNSSSTTLWSRNGDKIENGEKLSVLVWCRQYYMGGTCQTGGSYSVQSQHTHPHTTHCQHIFILFRQFNSHRFLILSPSTNSSLQSEYKIQMELSDN